MNMVNMVNNIDYNEGWGQYIMIDIVDDKKCNNNNNKVRGISNRVSPNGKNNVNTVGKMEIIEESKYEDDSSYYNEYGDYSEYGYGNNDANNDANNNANNDANNNANSNDNYKYGDRLYLINRKEKIDMVDEKNITNLVNSACCCATGILFVTMVSVPYYVTNLFSKK